MCLGINENPKCDGDYISTKDFNKLEDLVINKTEEMASFIDNSMKRYNDGLVLKIDDRLKAKSLYMSRAVSKFFWNRY